MQEPGINIHTSIACLNNELSVLNSIDFCLLDFLPELYCFSF